MEQPLSMTNGSFTFNVPRQIEEREKQAASHTKKASYGKPKLINSTGDQEVIRAPH
jgi:hypothetical protein